MIIKTKVISRHEVVHMVTMQKPGMATGFWALVGQSQIELGLFRR